MREVVHDAQFRECGMQSGRKVLQRGARRLCSAALNDRFDCGTSAPEVRATERTDTGYFHRGYLRPGILGSRQSAVAARCAVAPVSVG